LSDFVVIFPMLLLIIIIISLYRINNKINEIRTKIRENDEKNTK